MKKTNYGTIVLMVIGLVICVGCSQVSFNNPFGESEPTRTNVDTADNTADNQDASSDDQTDKSKPIEYKIHYLNAKNANNPNKTSFLETDTIVLKDVSADGFTFDGWYEVTDNIADTSTDGWNAGSKTADVTLWAKWSAVNNDPTDPVMPAAKVYTIRFDNNGGSGTMSDITADVGTTITLPVCTFNAPTGKKFSSWNGKADGSDGISYADGASIKNLSETDGEAVTLYAQWIDKDAHRIIYQNTKNADNSLNPTSFKESEPVMLTDVGIPGYTFGGWYDSSTDGTIVTGWSAGAKTDDVTLWAKWTAINNDPTDPIEPITPTAKVYTIKFGNNAGSGTMTDITADVGATITLPTCIFNAPTGKKFGCWNVKSDGTDGISYADCASVKNLAETDGEVVTLYAQWIDKEAHRIIYQNIKNADNSSNPTYFMESESVALADVTTDGYTFDGWYDSSSDFGDAHHVSSWAAGEQTSDVILYAKWTANEVTYTVKRYFQNVSGSGYDASADIVKSGLTDEVTDVTADIVPGFTALPIVQQSVAADGSTVVSVYYDRNVIVYTFNANGGSWNDDSNVKKAVGLYGAEVETPVNPARVGYTYAGWDKSLPTVFGETVETWTAQWTSNSYTVNFNNNGGFGSMSNLSMTYGTAKALTANTFTRAGYTFLGWSKNSSAASAAYTDGQSVSDLSSNQGDTVTLYAVWKITAEAHVGDIMYSDMTFSSEYVAGKTPIGIVFEVGAKVKILHLSQSPTALAWCLSSADGYKCNPPTSTSDGSGNWQIICDAVSDEGTAGNYPAFEYVNGLGSGWYMPAKDELNAVYTNITAINTGLTVLSNAGVSVTTLGTTSRYWSSSSYNIISAWYQRFSDGNQYYSGGKTGHYSVRAVRAF